MIRNRPPVQNFNIPISKQESKEKKLTRETLNRWPNHNLLSDTGTTNDPIEKIINKYQNHLRITSINKHMTHTELTLSFQSVTKEQITNLIRVLNNKKTIQSTDIPTKLIK